MRFKTGLVSLLVVCGACSQATKEVDVVKDSFDFAGPCFSPYDRGRWNSAPGGIEGLDQWFLSWRIVVYV